VSFRPRKAVWRGLADKRFGREQLQEMQKVIEAEKCDLFDVLAYVAAAIQRNFRCDNAATETRGNQDGFRRLSAAPL
jgi:hypothetical protein